MMSIVDLIAAPILKIIDKVIPDPAAKAAAQLEVLRLQQSGELAELTAAVELSRAQNDVNKIEAGSASLFVSGWRPAVGWCCVAIFACNYIGVPALAWLSPLWDLPPPPRLEIGEVLPVLLGMLGLGGMRTAERLRGKA
jgi:hypothetical protein